MSTTAKVLVVVIFGLSVAFAVVSGQLFAKREKLRADYSELKKSTEKQIGDLEASGKKLESDKQTLKEDVTKAQGQIDALSREKELLTKNEAEHKEQITKKDALLSGIQTTIAQLNTDLKNKTDRLAAAEKNLADTGEDLRKAQETARQKELEAQKAAQAAKEAADKQKELEVALKDARTQLDIIKTQDGRVDVETQQVQTPVDSLVIKVDRSANLVVINKGREQGVEVGYIFTVYRGDNYIGDLRVESVAANVAAGSPVAGTMIGNIKEGDNASTRIR